MFNPLDTFHPIAVNGKTEPPKRFNYPFQYSPHPWVIQAAKELQDYLKNQNDFDYAFGWDDHSTGKMFGILIVQNQKKELGYLAAFSGKINEINHLKGFVPPIFDILNPEGFFKKGENELNLINQNIEDLENSVEYQRLKTHWLQTIETNKIDYQNLKLQHKQAKKNRDLKRKKLLETQSEREVYQILEDLIQESKRQHFELKDFKRERQIILQNAEEKFKKFKNSIDELKELRREKSADLQQKLHESYVIMNAKGKSSTLIPIFEKFQKTPPAGAGECAAPRLLLYAYKNNLKPISMGEFWWGKEPNSEIRKHTEFYPACKSKCEPILKFMLDGLEIDKNPISPKVDFALDIIYEDEYLMLVNKPAGVLSVPGKSTQACLWQKVKEYLGTNENPMMVHRLDMSTSGLILIAKNMEVYRDLQQQFTDRKVKKTYTAILDGIPTKNQGEINLPLRLDLDHRPQQMHCAEHGKPAQTYFRVIASKENKAKVLFFPVTGRTHQLRVHSAHHLGLGIPILGDDLYGTQQDRLYLHSSGLEFVHPVSDKALKFVHNPSFTL